MQYLRLDLLESIAGQWRHVEAAGACVSVGGTAQYFHGVLPCHDEQDQL